jgi:hypothetical protein
MSSDLGSLDDVLYDDEMCTALAERRYNDLQGDELSGTLALWCESLDAEPSPTSIPTEELAEAAARRRSLRRTSRSLAAAAAVAAVCVGGLVVSKLAISPHHDRPSTVDTGGNTASEQARALIWQQIGEARTALMQKHWTTAQRLLAAAKKELPRVSAEDGRATLSSWIVLLSKAVDEHASLTQDAAPDTTHDLAPHQSYNNGVPLPPTANATNDTVAQVSTTLPMLPTTLPTLQPTSPIAPNQPKQSAPTTLPSQQPTRTVPPTHSPSAPPSPNPTQPTEPSPTLPLGPNSPSFMPPRLLPLPTAAPPETASNGDSSTPTSSSTSGAN